MNHAGHYTRLIIMAVLSYISMYILMYAMVHQFADVFPNINQAYMAGLMAAPMVAIEILFMSSMYPNRTANMAILVLSVVATIGCFALIRLQTGVGDIQFLKSMIPHHSGAILMCERANITNADIKRLCGTIVQGQRSEIDEMNKIINALQK